MLQLLHNVITIGLMLLGFFFILGTVWFVPALIRDRSDEAAKETEYTVWQVVRVLWAAIGVSVLGFCVYLIGTWIMKGFEYLELATH